MHTVNTCTLSFLSPNVAHNCCPLYSWCACSDSSSLAVSQNCHYLGSPVCWLYYLKNLTNCSHAAHGYHIKNIRSDVYQMYERSQFNSLVWDSLTLTEVILLGYMIESMGGLNMSTQIFALVYMVAFSYIRTLLDFCTAFRFISAW